MGERQKILVSLPAVQAQNTSLDDILRERERLMAEELKRARAERVELESKLLNLKEQDVR